MNKYYQFTNEGNGNDFRSLIVNNPSSDECILSVEAVNGNFTNSFYESYYLFIYAVNGNTGQPQVNEYTFYSNSSIGIYWNLGSSVDSYIKFKITC